MWTRGSAAVSRALPSFSVIEIWPVSATRKWVPAGDHRQLLGAVGRWRPEVLAEEVADLVPADVHAGEDEVIGRLAAQLLDEFAEVAFHDAVPVALQC